MTSIFCGQFCDCGLAVNQARLSHSEVRVNKPIFYAGEHLRVFLVNHQVVVHIGANVAEAEQAQSKPDFVSKMNIALKETSETKYWIKLLKATEFLSEKESNSLLADCVELEKILVSIIKTSKQ